MVSEQQIPVTLTRMEVDILRSITCPRAADPEAKQYGDWSVDLDRKLREALDAALSREDRDA